MGATHLDVFQFLLRHTLRGFDDRRQVDDGSDLVLGEQRGQIDGAQIAGDVLHTVNRVARVTDVQRDHRHSGSRQPGDDQGAQIAGAAGHQHRVTRLSF